MATPYGSAAYEVLASAIKNTKNGDPLAPATVVVPSRYVGLAAARALGSRSFVEPQNGIWSRGVAAVAFVTVRSLAERLGGRSMASSGRRHVSKPVIAGAVRTILRNDPGHFAGVETHPATERRLVEVHRELSEVSDKGLKKLAMQSERSADVVRIHRAVTEALSSEFSNDQQLINEAVTVIKKHPEATLGLGLVILFLPQYLSRSQIRLLRAVASSTETTVIAGLTGHSEADAAVKISLSGLGVSLDHSGTSGGVRALRQPDAVSPLHKSGGVQALGQILNNCEVSALSVSDADDEVRHAVREVVSAIRAGVRPGRCAIIYGASQPYARLVGDALDAVGIERCGANVHTANTSWLGRSLLGLLALRGDGFSRRGVMAWLDAAHIRIQRRGPVPVAAWERVARSARVEAHISDWESRLNTYARNCRDDSARFAATDEHSWLSRRYCRNADYAEELLDFVQRIHSHLHPEQPLLTWEKIAEWCRGLIRRYLGGHRRSTWPEDEKRLAEKVDAVIDRLGDLDGIDDEPSLSKFLQALELELDDITDVRGRFGIGVLVGTSELVLGVEFDLVVVCGLAEGMLPSRCRDSALLPDRERSSVGRDMLRRGDRINDNYRELLSVLAAAKRALLLYPRGDLRRATDNSPSRWLLDVAEAKDKNGVRPKGTDLANVTGDWFREVPSFVAGLRDVRFPVDEQEYDMKMLLDCQEHHEHHSGVYQERYDRSRIPMSAGWDELALRDTVVQRSELRLGIDLRVARRSSKLTRFDGNLSVDGDLRGVTLPSLVVHDSITSASRLEAWARCPHAYFVGYLLGVDAIDDDIDNYRISPLNLGSLIHSILERWLREVINAGETPKPDELWPDRWRDRLFHIGEELCRSLEERGLCGRKLYWHSDRRRVLADLRRFLDFDNEMRYRHRSTPVAVELGFGMPGSKNGPISIPLVDDFGSEYMLRLRGSIDRLDTTESGGLVVVDYKTGSSYRYRNLRAEEPTPDGGHLQLVLYALAARTLTADSSGGDAHSVHSTNVMGNDYGEYWFVSSRGGFQTKGYRVDLARDQVLKTVGGIVEGISSGLFPMRPADPGWRPWVDCHFCEPDGLGTRIVDRDWKRKCNDPVLGSYIELITTSVA